MTPIITNMVLVTLLLALLPGAPVATAAAAPFVDCDDCPEMIAGNVTGRASVTLASAFAWG